MSCYWALMEHLKRVIVFFSQFAELEKLIDLPEKMPLPFLRPPPSLKKRKKEKTNKQIPKQKHNKEKYWIR